MKFKKFNLSQLNLHSLMRFCSSFYIGWMAEWVAKSSSWWSDSWGWGLYLGEWSSNQNTYTFQRCMAAFMVPLHFSDSCFISLLKLVCLKISLLWNSPVLSPFLFTFPSLYKQSSDSLDIQNIYAATAKCKILKYRSSSTVFYKTERGHLPRAGGTKH